MILGVGLGGFVDGILLHQLLQWHHMLTSTDTDNVGISYYPADSVHGLEMNTVWDGLFHTFTWLAVLVGLGAGFATRRTTELENGCVRIRVMEERDGQEWIDGLECRYTQTSVYVTFDDERLQVSGVWLALTDVVRR